MSFTSRSSYPFRLLKAILLQVHDFIRGRPPLPVCRFAVPERPVGEVGCRVSTR
jgi:hypothetical protein